MADSLDKVDQLEQRLQVVSEFAAMLAGVLCSRKVIDDDLVESILRGLKPASSKDLTEEQKQLSTAAGFEVERIAGEFRGARDRL